MIFTGITDEGGTTLDAQIRVTRELGWRHLEMRGVEVPGFPKGNIHDLPEEAFDLLVKKVEEAGLQVYGFGSTIGNWSKKIDDPFDITLGEVERAIPRMRRLGTRFIRIMSYRFSEGEDQQEEERFQRLREVTKRFLDAGLQPIHENCMNYGGMSPSHAVKLLENVPGLKWVFDTGNPVFNDDRSRPKPHPKQDPWEFWVKVRHATEHIHIKDARWNPAKNDADYTWPGEGDAQVRKILKDAFSRGYDAALSIEPHMVVVFHDANSHASESDMAGNYVEYGRRLERLVEEIRTELAQEQKASTRHTVPTRD